MRRSHVIVIALVAGFVTVGIPTHAVADVAGVRATSMRVAGDLAPGRDARRDVALPWRANMIGVSFDAVPAEVEVRVRALTADGWSPWTDVHADPEEAADGAEARAADQQLFTAPVWVGTASRAQIQIEAPRGHAVRNVRVHALNSLGDAESAGPVRRAARFLKAVLTAKPAATAHASASKPSIISRAQWNADESIGDDGPGLAPSMKMAFVHHTVNSNSYAKSDSDNIVRAIHRYHVFSRDYSDIAYNFLIDRYGQIFEGRKGGIDEAVIGAHTYGFNTSSTGMALIGDFRTAAPPSAMQTALKKLIAWKFDVHHIPVLGKVTMTNSSGSKSFNRVSGHRDATSTSCPGYETYRRLPSIRDGADAIGHPKITFPKVSSTTLRPDGDGKHESVTFSASFSRTVSWKLIIVNSAGQTVRSFSGSGTSMSKGWTGTLSSGSLTSTGRYTWRIDASRSGVKARAATGVLYVITKHPSGSVLSDSTGRYMLQGSIARPVPPLAYAAKYGTLPPAATGPGERGRYTAGTALGLRRGTLLKGPDGSRYIVSAGVLRRFATEADGAQTDVFTALGYDVDDLIPIDATALATLPPGPPVTDPSVHPDGTVVKDMATGQKYMIDGALRRPMSTLARRSRYRSTEVVPATSADLGLALGTAYAVRPGALVRDPSGGRPWLVTSSGKRQFVTWLLFERMGFTESMLIDGSSEDLAALPDGQRYG